MAVRSTGAARYYAETLLGGPTRTTSVQIIATTTAQILAKANPDRVGLVIQNIGSNDVFINFTADILNALGLKLVQLGGAAIFILKDDFTLVTEEWKGITQTSTSSVMVIELISDVIVSPETH